MAISLVKGQNTPVASGLSKLMVGLGWNPRANAGGGFFKALFSAGSAFDLDASCALLNANGVVRSNNDFVYFGNLQSPCGSARHSGDNLTGEGKGDDERFMIDLSKVPNDVQKLVFVVTIYQAAKRNQHFGMVDGAYIRIVDQKTNEELARYNLSQDGGNERAIIFGELYRRDDAWKFRAVGEPFDGEIAEVARRFGAFR